MGDVDEVSDFKDLRLPTWEGLALVSRACSRRVGLDCEKFNKRAHGVPLIDYRCC